MNKLERKYFEELFEDRSESADMLEKPSMRGIKNSVIEKYSDQAHFIYELLQNADDAGATSARFILKSDCLIFAHNGVRHFSVSDPKTEDEDSLNGKLGDINAITSIANSNKTSASIGKFGVGFKAVFQYTATPHIYDPNLSFKINRFIVPSLLETDYPGRRKEETMFVFPFDHEEQNVADAYSDISDKLKSLSFPILFLSNLKDIDFEIDETIGLYGKKIVEVIHFGETLAEKICLTQNCGDEIYDENLWLFSRVDEQRLKYSVGFFLDDDGHLKATNEPAFCFFPTKEVTGLKFVIHAPFLLTDSREGIRAGVAHNDNMIKLLADLAADTMLYMCKMGENNSVRLIDDTILSIIPIDEKMFSNPDDKRQISFRPFYTSIKNKFEHEEIIPAEDGYVLASNAYWAAAVQLPRLFSNTQLGQICGNKDAKWVFTSLGREETLRNRETVSYYIDSIVRTNLNEDVIIRGRSKSFFYNRYTGQTQPVEGIPGIDSAFIEAQPISWLHKFYEWLSETDHRKDLVKHRSVFLDQNGRAVPAFDNENQLILFLPTSISADYVTIHPQLLEKTETRKFVEQIGITEPSLRDQIYNIILPRYQKGNVAVDTTSDFKVFFKYYCTCPAVDLDDFFERIRECEFVGCYRYSDDQIFRYTPKKMYMPTDELIQFFDGKPDTYFVLLDAYEDLVDDADERMLVPFLTELGVKSSPAIIPKFTGGYNYNEKECFIDGLTEIIHNVVNKQDMSLSVFVWDELCSFIKENLLNQTVLEKEVTSRRDGRYKWHTTHVESSTAVLLKSQSWLVDKDGVFVSPDQISVDRLSDRYDMQNPNARDLIKILDIPERAGQKRGEDWDKLTEEQREQIEFAEKCKELGITLGDLEEIAKLKRMREKQERRPVETADKKDGTENLFENDEDFDLEGTGDNQPPHRKLNRATKRVIKDLIQRTPIASSVAKDITNESVEDDVDQDEFTPVTVDYSKKIEQAKQKSADEIAKIVHFEELQQTALTSPRYSFLWFKTLLEMEMLNSSESTANSKEISISFAQVELETGTQRTLILKHPNRYIPQFMEDLADIPLVLHMETQTKTVAVEVANIQSYTLRVKLKTNAEIKGVDLTSVTEATINAKNPVFLMEELYKKFAALEYEDEFNMQSNLCENIEFVFGPPGTGKTTYLASEILIPLVRQHQNLKVLVLTPTNKAADVLTNRIMEISGDDTSYNDWLVRFGTTNDESVENSEVYRDKTFDPRSLKRNVTVTTIARFPYDFFMPNGTRLYLHSINWDYIVIDESSMIPLVNIVYVLYQKTPQKFIIAGDPFQIEPITTVDLWKNENIYTLVKLNSFENPTTIPHPYKVKLLTTQYRSIPVVGDIFSKLTYGGILNHFRPASSQRQLNIDKIFQMKTLNLIKFPVSKYESIYRAKRLQHGSPYQVYSALFTFEFANYISNIIARNNAGSLFKIGIVAPYRAQADLIDKLLASVSTPKTVEVQVSTIHGFQGDECDIIIAVFNTPPTISSSAEMFLNKRNIINVSISRARDYLFVIMPDDATNNIDNLTLIKRVESLMKETDDCQEFSSEELEILMFDNPHYLEENSFSTSHQSVNVYGLPEKRYEIRTEETAVDVQIHRNNGGSI